ncbi:MAG: AarF/UbiB family protein [Terriglobales bacterium]
MAKSTAIERLMERARARGVEPMLRHFLDPSTSTPDRVRAMETALRGPAGQAVREELGAWIVGLLGVLVPESYAPWRALVQDSMLYVVVHLSEARLAPKLVQQLELPLRASPERRLMLLISKVPGLQKLGQVLARNRELKPSLRRALEKLENGVSDVHAEEIRAVIFADLARELEAYDVVVRRSLMKEASVSAILQFTWRNPASGRRERGVFKVLKPYIPEFYDEDMKLLQGLAELLKRNHAKYDVAARGLSDTFRRVRQLLQHEIKFRGEQSTLAQAQEIYGGVPGVRVPTVFAPLCKRNITAISEEHGRKITDAVRRMSPGQRRRVAQKVVETLIGIPLFALNDTTMFHADPHAGNLLYDRDTDDLVILDWALTNRLSIEQRRHVALLSMMVMLRDPVGVFQEVQALSLQRARRGSRRERMVRRTIARYLDNLPLAHVPDTMDAMRLLQRLAFAGLRLPSSLILLRKSMFTLDGILYDIAGKEVAMDSILLRHLLWRWVTSWKALGSPLSLSDWARVQVSLWLSGSRWSLQVAQKAVNTGWRKSALATQATA